MRYHPIDPELFLRNRDLFKKRMKNGSIAVFHAGEIMPKSADGTHRFVQQTDFFYLTGIDQEECILILFPDAKEEKNREILFTGETNQKIALWEGQKLDKEEASKISGIETVHWTSEFERISRPLFLEAERIYLNTNEHTRAETNVASRDERFISRCRQAYPLHKYERSAPILHNLRAIKSAPEIELIREACAIADSAFRRILTFVRPGVMEYEIEAELFHEMIRRGSRWPAFDPIIASGKNSCVLHYVKNDQECQSGDLLLIDFGAEYANYCSDVTRTIPVSGRFSERQKEVYDAVLRVHRAIEEIVTPGISMKDFQKETERRMTEELIELKLIDKTDAEKENKEQSPVKKYFPHGVSHHLGLDVHDVADRYRKIEPGMVITCEPGIYIPGEGFGIRIENDYLITENGPVNLTGNIPVETDEIERLMHQDKFR